MSKTPLNEFISQVKSRGFANSNKFVITIAPIPVVNSDGDTDELIRLFCDTCQLPDQNISTAQTRTYGEVREVPYENLYGNISMSFYVDSDFKVKYFFDTWIQSISNTETRHWEYYKNYISESITIDVLNNAGENTYSVVLYECYPKSIQAISLDYGSKEIVKCTVSMNYKYWRSAQYDSSHESPTAAVQIIDQNMYASETIKPGGNLNPSALIGSTSGKAGYPIPGFPESTALSDKLTNPFDKIKNPIIQKVADVAARMGGYASVDGAIRGLEGRIENAVSAIKGEIAKKGRLPGSIVDEVINKFPNPLGGITSKFNSWF